MTTATANDELKKAFDKLNMTDQVKIRTILMIEAAYEAGLSRGHKVDIATCGIGLTNLIFTIDLLDKLNGLKDGELRRGLLLTLANLIGRAEKLDGRLYNLCELLPGLKEESE